MVATPALCSKSRCTTPYRKQSAFTISASDLHLRDSYSKEKSLQRLVDKVLFIIDDMTRDVVGHVIGLHNLQYWGAGEALDLVFQRWSIPRDMALYTMSFL